MEPYNPDKHGSLVNDNGLTPYDPKAHGEIALESAEVAPKETPKFHAETDHVFTHFAATEGTKAHVGIDKENLTLARGIVPDSIMFDGQEIRAGKNTIKDNYLQKNLDKVDYASASKTVNGKTFVGADYADEATWGKAVLNEYVDVFKKTYPAMKDPKVVNSFVGFMWNTSSDGSTLGWSGPRTTLRELQKAPNQRNSQKVFDIVKHSFSGGQPVIGLLKRRVQDLNLALDNEMQGNFVTMAKGADGGTDMMVFDSEQNLLYKNSSKKPFPYKKARTIDVFRDKEVDPMTEPAAAQSPDGQVVGKRLESGLYEDDQTGKQYIVRPNGEVEELGGERDPLAVSDEGVEMRGAEAAAEFADMATDFTPGIAEYKSGKEAIEQFGREEYLAGTISAAGALPFIGGIARAGMKASKLFERFSDKALEHIDALTNKSKEVIVEMDIRKFLGLAAEGVDPEKTVALKGVAQFDNIPLLDVRAGKNGIAEVVDHDGRHRARELLASGEKTMPVRIKSDRIRWDQQADGDKFDYIHEFPTKLRGQEGGDMASRTVEFPVKRGQHGIVEPGAPVPEFKPGARSEAAEKAAKEAAATPEGKLAQRIEDSDTSETMKKLMRNLKDEKIIETLLKEFE